MLWACLPSYKYIGAVLPPSISSKWG